MPKAPEGRPLSVEAETGEFGSRRLHRSGCILRTTGGLKAANEGSMQVRLLLWLEDVVV
jgi:hypothetical protein